ncbi:hypothetical protein H9P43_009901 [Blastocladiella emersonii ATCC 22665]|nr:hypothetical protein H9P43_009901 [Blastocladiella emersonii ATCC 22665]
MATLIQNALKHLKLPLTRSTPKNLYEVLARQPLDGVGAIVRPVRYSKRNYPSGSFFKIVYTRLDLAKSTRSKAWAYEYWNGKLVGTAKPLRIRNGLKEEWEVVHHASPGSFHTPSKLTAVARAIRGESGAAAAAEKVPEAATAAPAKSASA